MRDQPQAEPNDVLMQTFGPSILEESLVFNCNRMSFSCFWTPQEWSRVHQRCPRGLRACCRDIGKHAQAVEVLVFVLSLLEHLTSLAQETARRLQARSMVQLGVCRPAFCAQVLSHDAVCTMVRHRGLQGYMSYCSIVPRFTNDTMQEGKNVFAIGPSHASSFEKVMDLCVKACRVHMRCLCFCSDILTLLTEPRLLGSTGRGVWLSLSHGPHGPAPFHRHVQMAGIWDPHVVSHQNLLTKRPVSQHAIVIWHASRHLSNHTATSSLPCTAIRCT